MRRVIAAFGTLALAGTLAVDVAAQRPSVGVISIATDTRPTLSQACDELGSLRQQLARLHQELRELEAAMAQARHDGNRERAQQIAHDIRRLQSQIQDIQHKMRRLEQVCRG